MLNFFCFFKFKLEAIVDNFDFNVALETFVANYVVFGNFGFNVKIKSLITTVLIQK